MINRKRSAAVVRTSLVAALIGVGLVAAVMEVQADLAPRDTQRAALRVQFDPLWKAHVVAVDRALAQHDVSAAVGAWHDAYGAALASRENALIRAHRDGSTDGMRRAAEAFAALGDHAVATQCLRVADELAAGRKRI